MQFNKSSFWSLLSNTNITIPIIQQAYTQGGRGNDTRIEEKGKKFLERLIEALRNSEKPILLDFIYGSESKNKVSPLDGQQRLTTLFLLHWYIAQKESRLDENVKETFLKFTYETRQSSRCFCEQLSAYTVPADRKEKLSDTIRNEKWYMSYSWNADPTICSMLGMLDKIDVSLKDDPNSYWDTLTSDVETCPITFFYTSLQKLNLSDDLYIKMNARGLELTDFEKLKAAFNQKIDEEGWDNKKDFKEKFGYKIDRDWTDLFWKYRGDDKIIDNELVNFIAGIAMYTYAINHTSSKKDEVEERIKNLANDPTKISPEDFNKDDYNYLVSCLDLYAEHNNDKIKAKTDLWNYTRKDSTLFEDFIFDNPNYKRKMDYYTYPMRVIFFAQTEYLLNNTFDEEKFNEWIRVVRNIVENSNIDSATTFISATNLIRELSKGSNDIYKFLITNDIASGHAKTQVEQEIEKARIIEQNVAHKQIIFDTEDTNFFKGDIDFALYCVDYDNTNVSSFNAEKLKNLQEIIKNELDVNKKITDDFKRAFLTIKNNDYFNKIWFSWSDSFGCYKRKLLEKNSDLVSYFVDSKDDNDRNYLKDLLVERMNKTSFAEIADNYSIPEGMPKWKEKLIKGTAKLNGATYILIPRNDDSYCYLAKQQRPSKENHVRKIE